MREPVDSYQFCSFIDACLKHLFLCSFCLFVTLVVTLFVCYFGWLDVCCLFCFLYHVIAYFFLLVCLTCFLYSRFNYTVHYLFWLSALCVVTAQESDGVHIDVFVLCIMCICLTVPWCDSSLDSYVYLIISVCWFDV